MRIAKKEAKLLSILASRHYLVADAPEEDKKAAAYRSAYLLVNFGVEVDKPLFLSAKHVKLITDLFELHVPRGFYNNPQDTKFYKGEELYIERAVSYALVEEANYFERVAVFKKELPERTQGEEMEIRRFKVVSQAEADEILRGIMKSYCAYTRPFGWEELEDFKFLYEQGYYDGDELKSRENVISLLDEDIKFARFLDWKDAVKLSIRYFGDGPKLNYGDKLGKECLKTMRNVLLLSRPCPLSKRQAKYLNKIRKVCGIQTEEATNAESPYKAIRAKMKEGDPVGAAKLAAKNGSLLQRNLRYFLSRADEAQSKEILSLVQAKNPIVLCQLVSSLSLDDGKRTFSFTHDGLVKKHVETDYETTYRKSRLSKERQEALQAFVESKAEEAWRAMPSLGKVYVSPSFCKIAVPTNTSASGSGLDVLPTGSRVPIESPNIRAFVYWRSIWDIDLSSLAECKDGSRRQVYWGNYDEKAFGDDLLFSGDCRAEEGSEYFDFRLEGLKEQGVSRIYLYVNGYGEQLSRGKVYCGYQAKEDLETEAWDPKNIAFKFRVTGQSNEELAFALDLETNEIVVLNLVQDSDSMVMNPHDAEAVKRILSPDFLKFNCGRVAEFRSSEVVEKPEDAEIVFDDDYEPKDGQKVVRSWELEKLVALVSGTEIA